MSLSVCPSVWACADVLSFYFVFLNIINVLQNVDLNHVFLSDIIFADVLWFAAMCFLNKYAVSSALIFSFQDMKYFYLINLFTIIYIVSYIVSVSGFLNFNNLMMKFIAINSHACFNVSSDCNFLYNWCCNAFDFLHLSHCLICFFTAYYILKK